MRKTMWIKAKPGLRIPRPESSYRYVEGETPTEVDVSTFENLAYWTRRIDHGECDKVDAPTPAPDAEAPPARAPLTDKPMPMVVKPSDGDKQEA